MNDELVLAPAINSYFTNGIPISELHISAPQKKQLQAVINAWEYYQQNPWTKNIRPYFKSVGRTPQQIINDVQYFEYIKENFSFTSRVEAQNMVDYLATSVARSASLSGDRQDQLKAAALLIKAHQLDKPAPIEGIAAHTASMPMVLITDASKVKHDAENHNERERLAILRKYGGKPDESAEAIRVKAERIMNQHEEDNESEIEFEPTWDE